MADEKEKSFLFTLKSEEKTPFEDQFIAAANPNQILYGICYKMQDYIEVVKRKNIIKSKILKKNFKFFIDT